MSILEEAQRLVSRDRNAIYGPPARDYAAVAGITSAALRKPWRPEEALVQMLAVKLARIGHGIEEGLTPAELRDSLVDLCGYAECLWQTLNE